MKLDRFLREVRDAGTMSARELVNYLKAGGFQSGFPILADEEIKKLVDLFSSSEQFGNVKETEPLFSELAPTFDISYLIGEGRRYDKVPHLKIRRIRVPYELTGSGSNVGAGLLRHTEFQGENYQSVLIVSGCSGLDFLASQTSTGSNERAKEYLDFLQAIKNCAVFLRGKNIPFCISHLEPEPVYWPDERESEICGGRE